MKSIKKFAKIKLETLNGRSVKNKAKNLSGALILNAGYEPLRIVHWQKAMVLWLQGKVEVLEFHDTTIQTPSRVFQLPSVIRLYQYVRPYFTFRIRLSRQNVFLRDNYQCQYCGKKVSEKKLTIDHIIPISKGGQHDWENVVAACSSCNNRKGNKTLEQVDMKLLKRPKYPHWLSVREFNLSSDGLPTSWGVYLSAFAGAE